MTITLQVFGSNSTLPRAVVNYANGVFSAEIDGRTFSGQVRKTSTGLSVAGKWSWPAMGVGGTWRAAVQK